MEAISIALECLLNGLFAGLTVWGLARIGLLPIIGVMVVRKGEDDDE